MDFIAFKDWSLLALLSGAVYILWDLKQAVYLLSIQMAVIVEKTTNHEIRISDLEKLKKPKK